MKAIVQPSTIGGSILAPRSKSDMQRACAAALLHKGTTFIHQPGHCNDDLAALDVIQKLGAVVVIKDDFIEIKSEGVKPINTEINCGESGLGIRMFTPIAAMSEKKLSVVGTGSLLKRPMNFFDEIFPKLGIEISSNEGKLPIEIQGSLVPKSIEVDGSLSSQFLTGLLMAFSASDASYVVITVNDLKSKPYIDMTLHVIKAFGMKEPTVDGYRYFSFGSEENKKSINPINYTIEGDWSGAAFLFVAGAISGTVVIEGMREDSVQADKKILEAIKDSGGALSWEDGKYKVAPAPLKAFEFDATECPDLFPPLVALAAYCDGITKISGTKRLTHKESDRAITLQDVFGKMGIVIELQGDLMLVHGGTGVGAAEVSSHHDHRIAMAAAVAALGADGNVVIQDAEAINKSYPDFYEHIISLGATVKLQTN
jgi:3-phosphoshikimate 1-carboxyvinyltransferase